ncbi:MAG: GatB/YqeY domain-containing protein [Patescibacteria group bacterium]
MLLYERIEQDLVQAMKAKDELTLSALRLVRSSLKNKQIELQHALSDEESEAVIRSMVKQYRDALSDFTKAGRDDLASRQRLEIGVLSKYLPAALSDEEVEAVAKRVIEEDKATSADIGKVMGRVMKELGGRVDGNTVRAIVQRLLGE